MPTILDALKYEKANLCGEDFPLCKDSFPIDFFIGEERHMVRNLRIDSPGKNFYIQTNDIDIANDFSENIYISSLLYSFVKPCYYAHGLKKSCFSQSDYKIYGSKNNPSYSDCIIAIDEAYKRIQEHDNSQYTLFILSNISQSSFFTDVFLHKKMIDRSLYFTDNPFESSFDGFSKGRDDSTGKRVYCCYDKAISVEQEIDELITKGVEYGVSFVICDTDSTLLLNESWEKRFVTITTHSQLKRRGSTNTIHLTPWSAADNKELGTFLYGESPQLVGLNEYLNVLL